MNWLDDMLFRFMWKHFPSWRERVKLQWKRRFLIELMEEFFAGKRTQESVHAKFEAACKHLETYQP